MKRKQKSIFWTAILVSIFTGPFGLIYPAFIAEEKYKGVAWKGFWLTMLFGGIIVAIIVIFWLIIWSLWVSRFIDIMDKIDITWTQGKIYYNILI